MEIAARLIERAAVLVTVMFVMGRLGLTSRLSQTVSRRDAVLSFSLFALMALLETWLAARGELLLDGHLIVVATAGLMAGPLVGVAVGLAAATFASVFGPQPAGVYFFTSIAGGLLPGLVRRFAPQLAQRPLTGFLVGALFCLKWYAIQPFVQGGIRPDVMLTLTRSAVTGAGVALLLLVADQVRQMDLQARAATMAEVRALQARMNPHFVFNALNTIAALARVDPNAIPTAASKLALVLRSAFELHDRPQVSLREELEILDAYLEIERLRFGDRLTVTQEVDEKLLPVSIPPFLLQPIVENAVRYGTPHWSSSHDRRGRISLSLHDGDGRLHLRVEDNGPGIPPGQKARALLAQPEAHALGLLQRRLEVLYDRDFTLLLDDAPGGGTVVSLSIPLELEPTVGAAP